MIFGHVYTILPPVLDFQISYSKFSYIHLLLLHFSLIIRFYGDIWLLSMKKWRDVKRFSYNFIFS